MFIVNMKNGKFLASLPRLWQKGSGAERLRCPGAWTRQLGWRTVAPMLIADFVAYVWALWGYEKWLLAGGLYLLDTVLRRMGKAEILDRFMSRRARNVVEVGLLVAGLFGAGFLAWRDEHGARLVAEGRPALGRRLSADEKAALRRSFAEKKGAIPIIIISAVTLPEAGRYALDFAAEFQKMGFAVTTDTTAIAMDEDDRGLMVGVIDPAKPSEAARAFIKGMLDAGFRIKQVKYEVDPGGLSDFDLFVGERARVE